MTDLTALSLDDINNALDYCHETLAIESDADKAFDDDWAREEALRQMREDEAKRMVEFDEQVHEGYKIGDLRKAFEKVQNPEHWKMPIQAGCDVADRDITAKAIVFFTGSVARFTHLHGRTWLVEAEGYYAAVGA